MTYSIGLFVALVGSSLAVVPLFADAFGGIKIIVALIGALILWLSLAGRARATELDGPIEACLLALAAATCGSIDVRTSLVGVYSQPFHGLLAILPALLIFYAAASAGAERAEEAVACAAAVALAQGLASAAALAGAIPEPFGLTAGRAIGTLGSPVFMGTVLSVCLPASIWLASRPGARGWLGWAGSIGGFLAAWASGSRGPLLAILAGLWAMLAASGAVRPRWRHAGALAALLAAGIAFSWAHGKRQSDVFRAETWAAGLRAGAERPLLGWGPDTFPLLMRQEKTAAMVRERGDSMIQASAHNDLIQAWATTGLVGLTAYLLLWTALLLCLWRVAIWDESGLGAAVFGSLVALAVVLKVNPPPPPAIYIGAALAGASHALGCEEYRGRWSWTAGLLVLLAALPLALFLGLSELMFSVGNLTYASGDVKNGADFIRSANELDPANGSYALRRFQAIVDLAPSVPLAEQKDFARRALRVAAEVARVHPNDPASWVLMGSAEGFAAPYFGRGLLRGSMKSMRRACELDPLYLPAIARWLYAAVTLGDRAEEREAAARLSIFRAASRPEI